MTYLTLGPVNIPITWLAFFIAIIYSDLRNRTGDVKTNRFIEHAFFTYVLIWKASYVLFSWHDFMRAPFSLVYFDGGLKGHMLALAAISILLLRKRQLLVWQEVWQYWARFVAMYHMIYYAFSMQWLLVILFGVLFVLIERKYAHGLLVAELLLLVWLTSFTNAFTIAHMAILLAVFTLTKQAQILALAVVASLAGTMFGNVESTTKATVRETIELRTAEGKAYRFAEQGLTVVNFFATWCPPCKAEMPQLQSFAQNLPEGVEMVGINLTARDDGEQALIEFINQYDVTYPILLDETDAVGTAFEVMSIPTTVLLNAQGEELARIVGPVSEDGLRQFIKKHEQ